MGSRKLLPVVVALAAAAPMVFAFDAPAASGFFIMRADADMVIHVPVATMIENTSRTDFRFQSGVDPAKPAGGLNGGDPSKCGTSTTSRPEYFQRDPVRDDLSFDEGGSSAGAGTPTGAAPNASSPTVAGCGEIGFRVTPPADVHQFTVLFESGRLVKRAQGSGARTPAANCAQEVHVADDRARVTAVVPVFDPGVNAAPTKSFELPFVVPNASVRANLTFYFADQGVDSPAPGATQAFGTASAGVECTGWIRHVKVRFTEVPVSYGTILERNTTAEGDHLRVRTVIAVTAPPSGGNVTVTALTLHLAPGANLTGLMAPDGARIPVDSLLLTESGVERSVKLPAALVTGHGNGTYAVEFVSFEPVPPVVAAPPLVLVPLALALLVAPATPGAFAALTVRRYRREAAGIYVRTARVLVAALVALVLAYVFLAFYVVAVAGIDEVATVPFTLRAWFLDALLVLVALSFVALAIIPSQSALEAMRVDLAERRRISAELERSNRELEHFAYVASHDLQEPLRTIAGFSQLLANRYSDKLDDRGKSYVDRAVKGSQRMQTLINDLLAYSRIQTQGQEFHPVDLEALMTSLLADLGSVIEREDATITHDPMPTVAADSTQIGQVFSNLLRNAIKYRHPERAPVVHVSATDKRVEWEFAVQDNGIGIESQYFERIFIIFQRLPTPDEREAGTGLGLAITKRIVERHGGRIWVGSTFGEGSTFHFTIPKQREEPR